MLQISGELVLAEIIFGAEKPNNDRFLVFFWDLAGFSKCAFSLNYSQVTGIIHLLAFCRAVPGFSDGLNLGRFLRNLVVIRTAAHSHIRTFAHSHCRTAAHSHIRTFALPHIRTAAHSHIRTFAHSHIRTFALPHYRTTALPHYRTAALSRYLAMVDFFFWPCQASHFEKPAQVFKFTSPGMPQKKFSRQVNVDFRP
jgi:hypothetical protein